jgi:hypothetical protein
MEEGGVVRHYEPTFRLKPYDEKKYEGSELMQPDLLLYPAPLRSLPAQIFAVRS